MIYNLTTQSLLLSGRLLLKSALILSLILVSAIAAKASGPTFSPFITLEARMENNKPVLHLTDTDAQLNLFYILERSLNGTDFEEIERLVVQRSNPKVYEHDFTDKEWQQLVNIRAYYRIRAVDAEGWFDFSTIATVYDGLPGLAISVEPILEEYALKLKTNQTEEVGVTIFDSNGKLVSESKIKNHTAYLNLPKTGPGIYTIKVNGHGEVIERQVKMN